MTKFNMSYSLVKSIKGLPLCALHKYLKFCKIFVVEIIKENV